MRISDWSSDVCSSDLRGDDSTQEFIEIRIAQRDPGFPCHRMRLRQKRQRKVADERRWPMQAFPLAAPLHHQHTVLILQFRHPIGREAYADRKRVVTGKSVSVSVDRGGRRIIKK